MLKIRFLGALMSEPLRTENEFLNRITTLIEDNISNENFGVSELAEAVNMSRSNLLRKVNKLTKLSVSQFIRQVRLKKSMELLRKSSMSVSEVSYQVGFGSTSYFIKCFREYYGYPPGEVGKREQSSEAPPEKRKVGRRSFYVGGAFVLAAVLFAGILIYAMRPFSETPVLEKSIAVLPFKNESSDSSNIYLINGLMESTLTNLQLIRDLRVVSRASTEKYRNTTKSITEMARELQVSYLVEGSGQKMGDQILLNIQLIEASSDRHLWARQYRREASDIFDLQQEIAKNIADEIQAIITSDEQQRIEKSPTKDPVAYDFFLKGSELFHRSGPGDLEAAVKNFKKAIELDNEFALAYARAAMVYFYLDRFVMEKKYTAEIEDFADKAIAFDPAISESLIAKALSFMHKKENELAVPYLEKALEYNPNSGLTLHFLAEYYYIHAPNTSKYLEYALMGSRVDVAFADSVDMSNKYLQLSNAFIQAGFRDEALHYINKSLHFYPENPFSEYVKIFILFARDRDLPRTRKLITELYHKDTTRLDITQEVAKICFLMGDYESAYMYYKRFIEIREQRRLDIFQQENLRIAMVFERMGYKEQSEKFVKSYKEFADADQSIYKHLYLSSYYAYIDDTRKATEQMRLFLQEDNYVFWVLLMEMEPAIFNLKDNPECRQIMSDIKTKFWKMHEETRVRLEEKGLL